MRGGYYDHIINQGGTMKTDQEPCSVFSIDEIRDLRRVPWGMKLIIGLFIAIVAMIFVPFQTVTQLGSQVGTLTAIQTERRTFHEREMDLQRKRIAAMEAAHTSFRKRLYWIDRHSRETNEKMRELLKQTSGSGSGDQSRAWKLSRSGGEVPSMP